MKGILPLFLFGGLAYLIFSGTKKLLNGIAFSVLGFEIDKQNTSFSNIAAKLTLGIQNDSNTGAEFNRAYLQYYANGKLIGRTDTTQDINIKAYALTKITLPVNIPTGVFINTIGYSLFDLIQSKKNPVLEIKGKLFFRTGSIDVNSSIPLKVF